MDQIQKYFLGLDGDSSGLQVFPWGKTSFQPLFSQPPVCKLFPQLHGNR